MSRSGNIFEQPLKLLYLLIPFGSVILAGTFTMGIGEAMQVLKWILVLLLFGFAAFPISAYIFKRTGSCGFFLSQPLGLLLVSLLIWELTYLHVFRFTRIFIIITLIGVAAFSYLFKPLRENLIKSLSAPMVVEKIALEETLFAIVLTVLCYFKGFVPDINGQEKFMDYGFIMSMLRCSTLPANDMWLSGYSINYYYFGQFIYALVIKLSGIQSGIGYNISMCSAIAIPFSMCFAIGCMFAETAEDFGLHASKVMRFACGTLCAFSAIIFGNSHSFFYDEESMGNPLLKLFGKMGINVGRTDGFFYPDSTRYIGYNPDSRYDPNILNGGDMTIEEFPFYSFLVGDLHAHVVSTMVVLLIMAVCVSWLRSLYDYRRDELFDYKGQGIMNFRSEGGIFFRELRQAVPLHMIVAAVLLGCAQMTNYWDFLIYYIFLSMTTLVISTKVSRVFADFYGTAIFFCSLFAILGVYLMAGDRPVFMVVMDIMLFVVILAADVFSPSAMTRVSVGMSFIFTVANIIALPFNSHFDMISNSLAKCINHSSPFQLFILYGTHVFIGILFIVVTICHKNYNYGISKKNRDAEVYGQPGNGYTNPIAKFIGERNLMDVFVCGMVVVGILLIIAPEIFYVRDIYTSGYLRSNTMFKFTYAAFIILSNAMAYSAVRLMWYVNKKGRYSYPLFLAAIALILLVVIVPGHYTYVALDQRNNGRLKREDYKTLDGTAYLETFSSRDAGLIETGNLKEYADCIEWFNTEVKGNHVILEAYGESYHDYDIVSAYTGLQTVCGWETHEWLWRFHGIVDPETDLLISDPEADVWDLYLTPRHADIYTVYTYDDPFVIYEILDRYNVEYVILGDIERNKFSYDNTEVISSLGEIVYTSGNLNVIKINQAVP
ncbi:MAG: hypothetical protein II718_05530 [Clostridiales bacterium]|nr:hypothetical protein [Clostridiales bacterium]